MITVRTGELTGIFSDVIPFCYKHAEVAKYNCIRLEWDGAMLHALATDSARIGIASWHPDDDPDHDAQDDLITEFGGADEPWHILVPLDDAKDLVKIFKLPTKEGHVPVTVDVVDGRLVVKRSRDTGYSAITQTVTGETVDEAPDVRALLAKFDRVRETRGLTFSARFLADFAKVRPRGPMRMTFTGADRPVQVSIGERFVGAIMPISEAKQEGSSA